jgi:hypothetical protein
VRFVPLVACLAMACASPDLEGACKDFVAAANACNQDHADAKGNDPVLLDDELCVTDTSEASHDDLQAAVDRYDCKADAYASTQCDTDDGFQSAIGADASCDEG